MDTAVDRIRAGVSRRILNDDLVVPVLPQVATQVLQMASDQEADTSRLSKLIHRDQALAGQLLKVANSSLYGGRVEIVSLQQALARLGLATLCEITFITCVKTKVFQVPGHEARVRTLWRTSMAGGAYAKEIARQLRRNVETAFLCGLLHNVGKPVLLQVIAELQRSLNASLENEAIEQLLDGYEADAARKIVENWTLPEPVAVALLHHHEFAAAPSFELEAAMTHLASHLGAWAISDETGDETVRSHPAYARLNLYPDDVQSLLAKRPFVTQMVESLS